MPSAASQTWGTSGGFRTSRRWARGGLVRAEWDWAPWGTPIALLERPSGCSNTGPSSDPDELSSLLAVAVGRQVWTRALGLSSSTSPPAKTGRFVPAADRWRMRDALDAGARVRRALLPPPPLLASVAAMRKNCLQWSEARQVSHPAVEGVVSHSDRRSLRWDSR